MVRIGQRASFLWAKAIELSPPYGPSQTTSPTWPSQIIASPAGGSFPEGGSGFLTTLSERGGQKIRAASQTDGQKPVGRSSPSLVDTCITQQSWSPGSVYQALPGFVAAQITLSGDIVYPALPKPSPPERPSDHPLPGQHPLPWYGHQLPLCPKSVWLSATCEHGTTRSVLIPCKKRDCPICGVKRRRKMAWRVSHGIDVLGGDQGAAWFVGTWARSVSKKCAVRTTGKMIRWLRKFSGRQLEYATAWEVTKQGRLHVNIILAPWSYIPQAILSQKWERFGGGFRVWIERVGQEVGAEAAKTNNAIGGYLAKWEQMVMSGRGQTYSRGWPKLPDHPLEPRQGHLAWERIPATDSRAAIIGYEIELGHLFEVAPGEYASVYGERCTCFSRQPSTRSPPS